VSGLRPAVSCSTLAWGREVQAIDVIALGRKLSELSTDELVALHARLG
jgi:hypothetical protein